MNRTKLGLAVLVLCAATSTAFADDVVPNDLMSADTLEAQLQQDMKDSLEQNGVQAQEMDRDRDRDRGRDRDGRRDRRPEYPRYPRYPREPRPYRPYPRPYPYPVVTCYAQSSANGLTYAGSAYGAVAAQNVALNNCFNATGYSCVARGCTY
jgi:hypothetical protein